MLFCIEVAERAPQISSDAKERNAVAGNDQALAGVDLEPQVGCRIICPKKAIPDHKLALTNRQREFLTHIKRA